MLFSALYSARSEGFKELQPMEGYSILRVLLQPFQSLRVGPPQFANHSNADVLISNFYCDLRFSD